MKTSKLLMLSVLAAAGASAGVAQAGGGEPREPVKGAAQVCGGCIQTPTGEHCTPMYCPTEGAGSVDVTQASRALGVAPPPGGSVSTNVFRPCIIDNKVARCVNLPWRPIK